MQNAIILPVPEAELAVAKLRNKYDPYALKGIPAHISINYPFNIQNNQSTIGLHSKLNKLFSEMSIFKYQLTEISTFSEVIYLSPYPTEKLTNLIARVFERFPESPPYNGEFSPIPHLTIAQVDENKLFHVKEEIVSQITKFLPINAIAKEIWWIENREGIWKIVDVFQLRRIE
jgi:2'-5' RNA ligase